MGLFSKNYRIQKNNDFKQLRFKGKKISNRYLYAYYRETDFTNTRIAISVSRRVGNAVFRNKIKRIIRELFRNSKYKETNNDVLLIIDPLVNKLPYNLLKLELLKQFKNVFSLLNSCDTSKKIK
ncbi:MAG: ribonuclease P protein component [Bdellovibrionales bacterium]|jgi:ribonuclease P protein component|nr:ribonuclease P protein component [Bdellovibrionales bacterium]